MGPFTVENDGTVVLTVGSTTVRLRPLTIGENRRLREHRRGDETWQRDANARLEEEGNAIEAEPDESPARLAARRRAATREATQAMILEAEARNVTWFREIIRTVGDPPELSVSDEDLPAWVTSADMLGALQLALISPPGGDAAGRK